MEEFKIMISELLPLIEKEIDTIEELRKYSNIFIHFGYELELAKLQTNKLTCLQILGAN